MTEQDKRKKDPREIEAEIAETRAAISDDLNAIEQKLSPENLKQETREVLSEAKDAAMDKFREKKDAALESVGDAVEQVTTRAKAAGGATFDFAKQNAVPLALIGLGVGWLFMSARQRRASDYAYAEGHVLDDERDISPVRGRVKSSIESARTRVGELRHEASHGIEEGVEWTRERARRVGHRAQDLGHRAGAQVKRAEERAVDYARENPLAIGAAALAAGVGVGLLLPSTRPEDDLLGSRRDQLVGDVRETVEEIGRTVKQGARDMKETFAEPSRH